MNKFYIAWSQDLGYAVCLPLPMGFGLTVDLGNGITHFGSYYVALMEFLDYPGPSGLNRGDHGKKYNWSLLRELPLQQSLGDKYENYRRERHWNKRRNYSYQCWKCPEWHKLGRISRREADRMRKELTARVVYTSAVRKIKKREGQ